MWKQICLSQIFSGICRFIRRLLMNQFSLYADIFCSIVGRWLDFLLDSDSEFPCFLLDFDWDVDAKSHKCLPPDWSIDCRDSFVSSQSNRVVPPTRLLAILFQILEHNASFCVTANHGKVDGLYCCFWRQVASLVPLILAIRLVSVWHASDQINQKWGE